MPVQAHLDQKLLLQRELSDTIETLRIRRDNKFSFVRYLNFCIVFSCLSFKIFCPLGMHLLNLISVLTKINFFRGSWRIKLGSIFDRLPDLFSLFILFSSLFNYNELLFCASLCGPPKTFQLKRMQLNCESVHCLRFPSDSKTERNNQGWRCYKLLVVGLWKTCQGCTVTKWNQI